jgi:hypothetical protein
MILTNSILYPSGAFVLVSRFVSDCSLSESNNKYHRFVNVSTSQIDEVGLVKRSLKGQSRPVSLGLETSDLENVQQTQLNQDRAVLGTESGYSKLPRHSDVIYSLLTVNVLIKGT